MEKNQIINGVREGYWEKYYHNGNLWFKGNYIKGQKIGYWESHYFNDVTALKEYYLVD